MKFTEENSLKFFHYLTSLTDGMRPVLNTKDFENINPEYWEKSLNEFQVIISDILENKPKIQSSFLSDLFGENGFNQLLDLVDSIRKDQFYETLLSRNLQILLTVKHLPTFEVSDRINTAIQITNEVIAKLEDQKK